MSGATLIPIMTPTGNYKFKVNNWNTRTRCWPWTYLKPCSSISVVNFEHVIARWDANKSNDKNSVNKIIIIIKR